MLKKLSVFALTVALAASFAACGGGEDPADTGTPETPAGSEEPADTGDAAGGEYTDGEYVGKTADYDGQGWQETATVTIAGGKIASIVWDSQNKDTSKPSKMQQSIDGTYGMVAHGGSKAEWHEETAALCDYIVQTQDPSSVTVKGDGTTDAVASCTIAVGGFMEALNDALAQAK